MIVSKRFIFLSFLLVLVLSATLVVSHGDDNGEDEKVLEADKQSARSLKLVLYTSAFVSLLVIISLKLKHKTETLKWLLFLGIVIPSFLVSVYIAWTTVALNLSSGSGGPVHWHADFEVWNCGEKLDLVDPKGLSNRLGSPVFHEHGDNRVHVEGVIVRESEVGLHSFFEIIGGDLDDEKLIIPTNDGLQTLYDGQNCNGQPGELQMFLYRVTNPDPTKKTGFTYTLDKITDFDEYILAPYSNIPPGDCFIIEFDQRKSTTDKICETYRLAIKRLETMNSP